MNAFPTLLDLAGERCQQAPHDGPRSCNIRLPLTIALSRPPSNTTVLTAVTAGKPQNRRMVAGAKAIPALARLFASRTEKLDCREMCAPLILRATPHCVLMGGAPGRLKT